MAVVRLSPHQYTILKSMAPKTEGGAARSLTFEKAVEFNQVIFYSLITKQLIQLDNNGETFSLSEAGVAAYGHYTRGNISDYFVKDATPARRERVTYRLSGKEQQEQRAKERATKRTKLTVPAKRRSAAA